MTVNAVCDCSLISPVRTLVCDGQSTVRTQLFAPLVCCRVLRVCALLEGLTEFCFVFRFVFLCNFAGFYGTNRAVTLLLLLRRCMKSFSAFFVANTVAHAIDGVGVLQFSRRAMFTRPIKLCALSRDCYSDC